jgi:hypothetical protein
MLSLSLVGQFSTANVTQSVASYNLTTWHFWFGDSVKSAIILSIFYLIAGYLIYIFIIEPIWRLVAGAINFQKLRHQDRTYLEVTPPHVSEKSQHATEQFFTVVENFLCHRSGRRDSRGVLSLEMVSTKKEGVRYVVSVRSGSAEALQKHIATYLPEAKIMQTESPSVELEVNGGARYNLFEFSQQRHYAYPLRRQEDISQSDLVSYLLGSINKLEDNEATILQVVITKYSTKAMQS